MNKRLFVSEPQLDGNEERYVLDCLRTNRLSMGSYVTEFENQFARYSGTRYAVACMNGTVALHLALVALGLHPGDEVIVPTLTYVATANAVSYCGAKPILCEVESDTWCMDPVDLIRRVTHKTVGILPVHLYGHPANMDMILKVARDHNLWVLEDSAEAHGATYRDRPVGSFGSASAFSFYGNKIITCGEGGMVTTNHEPTEKRCRLYRGQGVNTKVHRYFHEVVGFNYRMTNIQAALGLAQLENIPDKLAKRKEVADHYRQRLAINQYGIEYQASRAHVEHANWMFSILVPKSTNRDQVMQKLDEQNIETRPTFRCMHHLPMYADGRAYARAEDISARGINLPTHAGMHIEDVDRVVDAVLTAIR